MNLETYLTRIERCSDRLVKSRDNGIVTSRLITEYGVSDNYTILLQADYDSIISDLTFSSNDFFSGKYKKLGEKKYPYTDDWKETIFNYVFGTVIVQVQNFVPTCDCTDWLPAERERQMREYNRGFSLHPSQEKRMERVTNGRALAIVIADISRYAQKRKIPLCLPRCQGTKHRDDPSRIVYYNPEK